jgi:excisionase family DNA binding protein
MNPELDPKTLRERLRKAQQLDGGDPKLITLQEAAARLRIGRAKMQKLIRTKQVRSVLVGNTRRVVVASLDDYVDSLERGKT